MLSQAKCQFVANAFEDENSYNKTVQMVLNDWEEEKSVLEDVLNDFNAELIFEFRSLYDEVYPYELPTVENSIIPHKKTKRKLFWRKK